MLTTITDEEMMEYDFFNDLFDSCGELDAEQQRVLFEEQLLLLRDRHAAPSDGKRAHPRLPCLIRVDYDTGDSQRKALISDICMGGLFIRTPSSFDLGQELTLTSPHPNGEPPIEFTCSVVRTTHEGIGVKFENLNFFTEHLIRSIFERLQEEDQSPA